MDALRRMLDTTREQLGRLGPTSRVLIGSFGVILVMGLLLVSQYAGRPSMVPLLPGEAAEAQEQAQVFLASRSIPHQLGPSGEVMVKAESHRMVRAQMAQSGEMPADTSISFGNILESQSWTNTESMNRQIYNIALQNELARTISAFSGVSRATVLIDAPVRKGLGESVRKPTAAVTVFMSGGSTVNQKLVDAVAHFVAGAKAGLSAEQVRVIDGSNGRQHRARVDGDLDGSGYLEQSQKVEQKTREKILEHLSYIPGVIVTVTAEVDVTRRSMQTSRYLAVGEGTINLPAKEEISTTTQREIVQGTRPGVQANVGADLQRGGNDQASLEQSDESLTFAPNVGVQNESVVDPRGMPTRVAASINVPSAFVESLISGEGEAGESPSEEQIGARFETLRTQIRDSVLPHLPRIVADDGSESPAGDVVVSLVPGDGGFITEMQGASIGGGMFTGSGGGPGIMGFGIEQMALLGLAGISVGAMTVMIRNAGKRAELPTAQEIAGLPPTLEPNEDVVGEADETDTAIEGIELDDDSVKSQKLLEQVESLIDSDPEGVGRLLKKWIQPEL